MNRIVTFVAGEEDAGIRLDIAISRHIDGLSRSLAQDIVGHGLAFVNSAAAKASRKLVPGDTVRVEVTLQPSLRAQAENIPLTIVYRDEDLAVVDKPAGLVVHPAPGHRSGTLVNALVSLFPGSREMGEGERPGIVHRLDKDTSGLMVVALTPAAQHSLQRQISSRSVQRRYLALTRGHVSPETGIIDAPIGRDRKNRLRMAAHGMGGRAARTEYEVIEELSDFTLLRASLQTGRTHQIRVHFAAVGHPIAGDVTYGGPPLQDLHRQFLHAAELILRSPTSGEELRFASALPPDLQGVLKTLRGQR